MITIYAPDAADFSTLGLGALEPYEVTIEERAGGMYTLSMVHPMDDGGKWMDIAAGCILKAPAPVRETPLVESEIVGEGEVVEPVTVTRKIYKVRTNTGANLHLRQGPSTSTRILSKYRPGTEVVVFSQANGWGQVIVRASGATGYMSMQYLVYVRDETETIEGDAPSPERVVYPVQSRMQLFRIVSVEWDAGERELRVTARHIFYDLLGNVVGDEYKPENVAADTVVSRIFDHALNAHSFDVHCQTARPVTGDYTRRGLVECLLDTEEGVIAQTGARLVRDNFDIWLLPDATRETGVTIRHGKNLLGAMLTTDTDDIVTRIIPIGQDKEGKPLLLNDTIYLDSPRIGEYPIVHARAIEYDVRVGEEGVENAAQARAKLVQLAEKDFDDGIDLPTAELDVDFIALGETPEYAKYADLQAVHLYDTVRVVATQADIDAAMRVTAYKWDALGKHYISVSLGDLVELSTTVYGYQIADQSVRGTKLANGAVGSAQIRDLCVKLAHIDTAAVEQLSANAINALKAYITELVADSVTTDALYAAVASIATAQLTTANISKADIDWAMVGSLQADVARIAAAYLSTAEIDTAQIADLAVTTAKIADAVVTTAKIADAAITSAKVAAAVIQSAHIEDAAITRAKIALLAVDEARIDDLAIGTAKIKDAAISTAKIQDLAVTAAQIANATITNVQIADATIGTAQIALGAITTALIQQGAVGTAQIADASITDAKIVELSANRITTGTLSVERLIIVGSEQSLVFAINEANGTPQLSQSTIDGGSLTQRSITADRIVAGAITSTEIAAATILANNIAAGAVTTEKLAAESVDASKIKAGAVTTDHVASNFGETLDLSSNTSIRGVITQNVGDAIADIEIGGVNLIQGSETYTLVADSDDSYWIAADELEPGMTYTFSVREVALSEGQAAGVTWKVVNRTDGSVHASGLLDFTYGKQSASFTLPTSEGNWALFLYAGVSGATTGVTVIFRKVKLEEGSVATSWSAAPEETSETLGQLTEAVEGLDGGLDERVQSVIDALGLSEQFASTEAFLAVLADIELIRSELSQTNSDLTLTFNRLASAENGIAQMFSYFQFGEEDGAPYLDMGSSESSVKMRLTNTRLSFVQAGAELAYFSDNKLYVTRLEAVEQISIGTDANGYLDIVTTPTGVGFKWRG
jgi:phage minor structural protein